jgi:hypothetical protein
MHVCGNQVLIISHLTGRSLAVQVAQLVQPTHKYLCLHVCISRDGARTTTRGRPKLPIKD